MKLIELIIITLLVVIILSQKIKFSNIYASDGITIKTSTVNTVQFTLNYTTPQYYTRSAAADNNADGLQKVFNPKPLLFLIDLNSIQIIGVSIGDALNNLKVKFQFVYPTINSLLNTPTPSTNLITSSPSISSLIAQLPLGIDTSSDVKNLININNLLNTSPSSPSVSITGNSTLTSEAVTCTIGPSSDIVTTPLVIGRYYALGISIMNGVNLPVSPSVATTWHGLGRGNITKTYSPFIYSAFILTDSMIIRGIANININYGPLINDYAITYDPIT